jgi:hypothetical protein
MRRNRDSVPFEEQPHSQDVTIEAEALDQQGHLAVVQGAINRTLDTPARRALYAYTYTHITEPNLHARSLLIIANGTQPYPQDLHFKWPFGITDAGSRLFEAHEVAREIIDHAALIDDSSIIQGGYGLVEGLEMYDRAEEPGALAALGIRYRTELDARG